MRTPANSFRHTECNSNGAADHESTSNYNGTTTPNHYQPSTYDHESASDYY